MSADKKILVALAVLLAVVEVFVDVATWIQLNVAIIYGLPLVVASASRSRRLIWGLALMLVAATFFVYALQIPQGVFRLNEALFIDRVLAAVSVLLTAGLLHALTIAIDGLEARRRQLDQQRMEAEEASDRKTRLLMSVSHDMRTPLTTINLMADLVKSSAANPDLIVKVPALAQSLQANALSLSDMVTDVLDISYFDSGRIALRESEFSLNDLVREECALMEPLAAAAGLTLSQETANPDVWLRADRVKLGRVLRNLVKNAIQFTPKGGVTVACALAPDGGVLIRVIDTGVGIAAENLERIFGEFAQLRGAQSTGGAGWGLGLAICRRLTRLMDGDVAIESEPSRGSVFIVRLPASRVLTRIPSAG
jgi:signal transduction histidine kinase